MFVKGLSSQRQQPLYRRLETEVSEEEFIKNSSPVKSNKKQSTKRETKALETPRMRENSSGDGEWLSRERGRIGKTRDTSLLLIQTITCRNTWTRGRPKPWSRCSARFPAQVSQMRETGKERKGERGDTAPGTPENQAPDVFSSNKNMM